MKEQPRYEVEYFNSNTEFFHWMAENVGQVRLKSVKGRTEFGVKGIIFDTIEWFVNDMRVEYYPNVKGYSVSIGSAVENSMRSATKKAAKRIAQHVRYPEIVGRLQRESYYQGGDGATTAFAYIVQQHPSGTVHDTFYRNGELISRRKSTQFMDDNAECWFEVNGVPISRYEIEEAIFEDNDFEFWNALRMSVYYRNFLDKKMRPENVKELTYEYGEFSFTEYYGKNTTLFDLYKAGAYEQKVFGAEPLDNIAERIHHFVAYGVLPARRSTCKIGTFSDNGKTITVYDARENEIESDKLLIKRGLFDKVINEQAFEYLSDVIHGKEETQKSFLNFLHSLDSETLMTFITVIAPDKSFPKVKPPSVVFRGEEDEEPEINIDQCYYPVALFNKSEDIWMNVSCRMLRPEEEIFNWKHIFVGFSNVVNGTKQQNSVFPFSDDILDDELINLYSETAHLAMRHFYENPSRGNDFAYIILKISLENIASGNNEKMKNIKTLYQKKN